MESRENGNAFDEMIWPQAKGFHNENGFVSQERTTKLRVGTS